MSSVLTLEIHSEISEFPTEKRFDPNIKISELKKKLELITGANNATMILNLTIGDKPSIELKNDEESLAYYIGEQAGKESSLKLFVKDDQNKDLLSGDVPKYTISEDKYLGRDNNMREFIKKTREQLEARNK